MNKHIRTTLTSFVLITAFAAPIKAEDVPLGVLAEKGVATTPLGTYSIEFFFDSRQFPDLTEKRVRPAPEDGVFSLDLSHPQQRPNIKVNQIGKISFAVSGFAPGQTPTNGVLPMLVFTPNIKGKYKIGGVAKFWVDFKADPEPAANFDIVTLSRGLPIGVYCEFEAGNKVELDLSTVPELKALPITDAIGITIWRKGYHYASGGTISGMTIEKAK